jgi:FKBP-type peptidyl-prolyl cis-trans isomerase
MRRIAVLSALPLMAAVALTGCGSPSVPASGSAAVTATGAFGESPRVTIPAQKAGSKLTVKTLVQGDGQVLGKTDAFVGNYAIYLWSGTSHKLLQSTFKQGGKPTLFSGTLLPGLETALIGKKMGSRVLAVIPPKEGFGTSGDAQAGIKGTDTLVFVIDMIKDFAGNAAANGRKVSQGGGSLPTVTANAGAAPTIKMPKGNPPKNLTTQVLIKGTGPTVADGDTVVVQYVGAIWRNGTVFDSSWKRNQPFGFEIGASPSQVIAGWDKGLVGQTVGSRVMLVIPPVDGYGKTGNTRAGIKGTDTLVFVVDILGAFGATNAGG